MTGQTKSFMAANNTVGGGVKNLLRKKMALTNWFFNWFFRFMSAFLARRESKQLD
jgi:hypothetical protein